MPVTWNVSDLSVTDPATRFQMGDQDRETLAFNAGQAVTTAKAELIRLDTLAVAGGPVTVGGAAVGAVEAVTLASTTASVTISGLTRGVTYELSVTFTTAAGRRWTRTLVIECVA